MGNQVSGNSKKPYSRKYKRQNSANKKSSKNYNYK